MDEKIKNIEPNVTAPPSLRRNVEGSLNVFRLIGAVIYMYTSVFFKTCIALIALLLPNSKPLNKP